MISFTYTYIVEDERETYYFYHRIKTKLIARVITISVKFHVGAGYELFQVP